MNKGITVAGSIYVDYYKYIEDYPQKGRLSTILDVIKFSGGCVMNTIINLARIDPTIPLYAYAGVGNDENGDYLIRVLEENKINHEGVKRIEGELTGFTDAMIIESTGERTFFCTNGANRTFSYDDIDFDLMQSDMFHMGYALMLESLDKEDEDYGTVMARTLSKVQSKGIKTSIDLASIEDERFTRIVHSCLPYCNYFIVNEIEAGNTVGISPYGSDEKPDEVKIRRICKRILELGVNDLVVIHAPEGGWAMTSQEKFYFVPSLKLPKGYIKGSVGAGDAFCAGMLYSLYKDLAVKEALENANAAAACSLGEVDSTSGMKKIKEIRKFYQEYKVK